MSKIKTPTGKLIAIEGIDGSGKTRMARELEMRFHAVGIRAFSYSQPSMATNIGQFTRNEFKSGRLSNEAAIFQMYAARTQLMQDMVIPALQSGAVAIMDRHTVSTGVYQGNNLDTLEIIRELNTIFFKLVMNPAGIGVNLWMHLNVDPVTALARIRGRGTIDRDVTEDKSDAELLAELKKYARRYKTIFQGMGASYDRSSVQRLNMLVVDDREFDEYGVPEERRYDVIFNQVRNCINLPASSITKP